VKFRGNTEIPRQRPNSAARLEIPRPAENCGPYWYDTSFAGHWRLCNCCWVCRSTKVRAWATTLDKQRSEVVGCLHAIKTVKCVDDDCCSRLRSSYFTVTAEISSSPLPLRQTSDGLKLPEWTADRSANKFPSLFAAPSVNMLAISRLDQLLHSVW